MKTDQDFDIASRKLDFLWVELTSRCNLRCIHCYADSEPLPETIDKLSAEDYRNLIDSAFALGCRKLQFIGGEPTLNPALPDLVRHAREVGFEFIEVFTNATKISSHVLECLAGNQVNVATSFYSHIEHVHDSITKKPGSFAATVKNIKALIASKVQLRAGIIKMDQNKDTVEETIAFLKSMGVERVGIDRVRSFGRGLKVPGDKKNSELSELCGSCWRGSVCISPDGTASPCIMAKEWSVGSVLDTDLETIVRSEALTSIRNRIHDEVWLPAVAVNAKQSVSHGNTITALEDCNPECRPNCVPSCNPQCSPNCNPCFPYGKCDPQLYG